jgi:methyltransferase-like protein
MKFGYKLKGLYNIEKMSVMSSVQQVAASNGFVIFARSFRANLINLQYLPTQVKQVIATGNDKHVIIQVSIKARADVMRLENFVKKLMKLNYSLEGADAIALHTNEFEKKSSNSKAYAEYRNTKKSKHHSFSRNKTSKTTPLSSKKTAVRSSRETFKSTFANGHGHSIYESLLAAHI